MDIQARDYRRASILRVVGRVDSASAPQLVETLNEYLQAGRTHLILETDGTDYISSAGLRALLSTQKALKERGGYVALAQPSTRVLESVRLAGFDMLFPVYDSTEAAIGAL